MPEIYSYGHRNPYRFSFDTATGTLIEGEAGQNQVEEVNIITKGGNYGWPIKEGTFLFNRTGPDEGTDNPVNSPGSPAGLIDPVFEYDHNNGIATIGGFVYHGSLLPQLDGMYVFGDLSENPLGATPDGRLFYGNLATGQIFTFDLSAPLGMYLKGFGLGADGEIYVLASTALGPVGDTGVVFELVPEPVRRLGYFRYFPSFADLAKLVEMMANPRQVFHRLIHRSYLDPYTTCDQRWITILFFHKKAS